LEQEKKMNTRSTSPSEPVSLPARPRSGGDTHQPDDAEIFAATPLVVGENRDAYKRLFLETWLGVRPRDGFEQEQVRQSVNYLWFARQLTRLTGQRLREPACETLIDELAATEHALTYWEEAAKATAQMIVWDRVMKNDPGGQKEVDEILTREDRPFDVGVLIALDAQLETHRSLQELVNKYHGYADKCLQRITKRRERLAKLKHLEVDDE
jgi:hypothetical protein